VWFVVLGVVGDEHRVIRPLHQGARLFNCNDGLDDPSLGARVLGVAHGRRNEIVDIQNAAKKGPESCGTFWIFDCLTRIFPPFLRNFLKKISLFIGRLRATLTILVETFNYSNTLLFLALRFFLLL
jgi:hypothetical protein